RQILIFFLSHGAKISVILSPLIGVVYACVASSAKWQEPIAYAMQIGYMRAEEKGIERAHG
ncbi:MAG TPA: hypothetical protein VFD87_06135, partial [Phototrophicaceae bacterium]|nr:hypothetical protein [Phototrophicaceae bacterium]